MRLNLEAIIHVPGTSLPFAFELDLSDAIISGQQPIEKPVVVTGTVQNAADVLALEGEARSELFLCCDRCMKGFRREKKTPLQFLLAQELEDEEQDDIVLLDGSHVDVGSLAYTAFLLDMDTKNLCSEDCKGLCPGCGVNRNEEACRCEREVDPRWAALSQLLDKTE